MLQKYILTIILCGFVLSIYGQQKDIKINNPYNRDKSYIPNDDEPTDSPNEAMADEEQIEAVIGELFAAMKRGDGNGVKQVFHPNAKLISTTPDQSGNPKVQYTSQNDKSNYSNPNQFNTNSPVPRGWSVDIRGAISFSLDCDKTPSIL